MLGCNFLSEAKSPAAIFSGKIDFLKDGDSIKLTVFKYGFFANSKDFEQTYTSIIANHSFKFKIDLQDYPEYFNLEFSNDQSKNLFKCLIEKDDNISLIKINNTYIFSGKGSGKNNIQQHILEITNKYLSLIKHDNPVHIKRDFMIKDSISDFQIQYLNSVKSEITQQAFELIKADIIGENLQKSYYICHWLTGIQSKSFIDNLSDYNQDKELINGQRELGSGESLAYSYNLPSGIIEKFNYDSCYMQGKTFNVNACYDYLKNHYSGLLRERLITLLILSNRNAEIDLTYCINNALGIVKRGDFLFSLKKLQSSRIKGAVAYNFSLTDTKGNFHRLSDYKGKVVVLDFWYTGCPACLTLAPFLFKVQKSLINKPVVFISICIDKNKNVWMNSVKEGKYTSDLSMNLYTGGMGKEDQMIKHYGITSYPTLLVIDKSGKLCANGTDPRHDEGANLITLINEKIE